MTRECITHHYACDCREVKFAELEAENRALREALGLLYKNTQAYRVFCSAECLGNCGLCKARSFAEQALANTPEQDRLADESAAGMLEMSRQPETRYMREALQDYIGLANVTSGFVRLMPEHQLYESVRQDVLCYLNKVNNPKQALADTPEENN